MADSFDLGSFALSPDVFFRKTPTGDIIMYQTRKQNVLLLDDGVYALLLALRENRLAAGKRRIRRSEELEKIAPETLEETVRQLVDMGLAVGPNILEERLNTLEAAVKLGRYDKTRSLYEVQFELTFRCNEHCRHCYCPTENDVSQELTTAEVKKVIDDLAQMEVVVLTFTGGDLFVRKDSFEILEYAYAKGFAINIFTNGTLIRDEDFFRLKNLYPRSVHFSIYNYIPEKHDLFTGVKGSFDKTVSAVKKCRLLGIPVNIKTSLVEENAEDIEGICRFVEELGCTIQISLQVTPKNDGDMAPTALRLRNAEKYAEIMKKLDRHVFLSCAGDFISDVVNESDRICGAGAHALNINPYGEVFPCNSLLISCGNVRRQSIKDIWEGSEALEKIRGFRMSQLQGCENCSMKPKCVFCPGGAMQETGNPLMKYDEACAITEAKIMKEKGETL